MHSVTSIAPDSAHLHMTPLFFRKITNVSELHITSFCRAENIGISFSVDRNLEKAYLVLLRNIGVFI
jgi:hypothetical protein